uniref:Uncharacterized protein n=1 Tax=Cacopsylla melanoneura TaxID=428564 RepID=A0A8D9FH60_9HEMI
MCIPFVVLFSFRQAELLQTIRVTTYQNVIVCQFANVPIICTIYYVYLLSMTCSFSRQTSTFYQSIYYIIIFAMFFNLLFTSRNCRWKKKLTRIRYTLDIGDTQYNILFIIQQMSL